MNQTINESMNQSISALTL